MFAVVLAASLLYGIEANDISGKQGKILSQYDQIEAEVNGILNVTLLQQRLTTTHANTFSFLLWDTDGHQYLDLVRFLHDSADFKVNGKLLEVWITLIPPSETQGPPLPPPNFTNCVHCPASHPYIYGGGGFDGRPATGGGFCCPVHSLDHEHCPGSNECCLAPIPGRVGCEGIKRCGTNPQNHTACPPKQDRGLTATRLRRVPPSRLHQSTAGGPIPKGEERCSVPADSPLTPFNESALVNASMGWRGCDDYAGWGLIIGKLALTYPMVKAVNIDDFSSNVPAIFTEPYVKTIRAGLSEGSVSLIPTFYYPGLHQKDDWLAKATDGVLFYFRNDKEGQAQCGQPSAANGGLCTPPASRSIVGVDGVDLSAPPTPCTACCLSGVRAELSLKNIASEIADFAAALPPSHPLHIGLYFSAYSHCVAPSPSYTREALVAALDNPAVAGATVYTFQSPLQECLPAEQLGNETDKGCIVRAVFANYSSSSSTASAGAGGVKVIVTRPE
jgi:hypothetical protein